MNHSTYIYNGNSLGTNNEFSYELLWNAESAQDAAIWGDYIFFLNHDGTFSAYSISEKRKLDSIKLDSIDKIRPHSNSVCFGCEKFEETDEFPLLYSNIYNNYSGASDKLKGVCCVYRIIRDGTSFSTKLVQVIRIGFTENSDHWASEGLTDVRPYGNFTIDRETDSLIAFTMIDKLHVTRYFKFDLPKVSDGEYDEKYGCKLVKLEISDIKSQFDCEYSNYIQGACCHNGMIYSLEGFSDSVNRPKMQVIDLSAEKQFASFDLYNSGLHTEPECIDFYGDTLYYIDATGKVRSFIFY